MGAKLCFVVMVVALLLSSCAGGRSVAGLDQVSPQWIPMALWATNRSDETLVAVIQDDLYVNDKLVVKLPQSLTFEALLKDLNAPLSAEQEGDKGSCLLALGDGSDVKLISLMHRICSYHGFNRFKTSYIGFRPTPDGPSLYFKDDIPAVNHWERPLIASHKRLLGVDLKFLRSGYALYIGGKLVRGEAQCEKMVTACRQDVDADVELMLATLRRLKVDDGLPVVLSFNFGQERDVGRVIRVLNRMMSRFAFYGGLVISNKILGGDEVGFYEGSLNDLPVLRSEYSSRLNQCVAYNVSRVIASAESSIIRCLSDGYRVGESAFGRWVVSLHINFDGEVVSVKNEVVAGDYKVFLGCFNRVLGALDFKSKAITGVCNFRKTFEINRP